VLLHAATGPAAGEFYYLPAALYSVTGLTDAVGVPVVRYSYDAYGLPRAVVGSPPVGLENSYLFTGRRLDFDVRDEDGSVTGQPGRPLLVLYDYRARAYDPWHGRFCQRDPAALVDTDVVRLAWRALALGQLRRNLMAAHTGLSQGPAKQVGEVLAASLESAGIRVRLGGRHSLTRPGDVYARHLDGLTLYQYARSNPLLYADPDGLFSLTELLGSTTIQSGILSGLLAGLPSGIFQGVSQGSWGAFFEGFGTGFAGGFAGGVAVPAFAASASGILANILSQEIAEFVGVAIANGFGGWIGSGLSSALSGQSLEQILADAAFGAFVGFGGSALGQALGYRAVLGTSTGGANIGEVIQDVSDLFNLVCGVPISVYFDLLRDYWEGQ